MQVCPRGRINVGNTCYNTLIISLAAPVIGGVVAGIFGLVKLALQWRHDKQKALRENRRKAIEYVEDWIRDISAAWLRARTDAWGYLDGLLDEDIVRNKRWPLTIRDIMVLRSIPPQLKPYLPRGVYDRALQIGAWVDRSYSEALKTDVTDKAKVSEAWDLIQKMLNNAESEIKDLTLGLERAHIEAQG